MGWSRFTAVSAGLICLTAIVKPASAGGHDAATGDWPDLRNQPGHVSADGSNDAALLVGIEHYAFLPEVTGATENVGSWESYLKARGIPTVLTLRDSEATYDVILEQAARVAAAVKPGGTLWMVFVGHGLARPKSDDPPLPADAVLVGVDAQQTANIFRRGVAEHELTRVLLNTPNAPDAHVVMVLDSCFSGKDQGGKSLTQLQAVVSTSLVDANIEGAADRLTILSAGKSDQFAGPLPHGSVPAFSYLALGALRGWGDANNDGVVTAKEAVGYAREVLERETGRRQDPELDGPDVPLAKEAAEPHPDLERIFNPPVEHPVGPIHSYVESTPIPASVWIGSALTVGLVSGGAVAGVVALQKHGQFDAANDGSNPSAATDLQSQTRKMNVVSDALFGGAIVTGVASVILFALRPTLRVQTSQTTLAPLVGRGGGGLAIDSRF